MRVLLEAITGQRAYPGTPSEAAIARLLRQPDVPGNLPGQWRSLLSTMTALDPADRPDAADVAAQLRSQPTGPIPVATIREVPAEAVDAGPAVQMRSASECRWARVLAYEPPHRVALSWDIGPTWQLETDPQNASDVEVRFVADGDERTRVQLEHRHLDRHGPGWPALRDQHASSVVATGSRQ